MKYLVGWVDDDGRMKRDGVTILEAKSVYDAKSKFLRQNWLDRRIPITTALLTVRARCLDDSRLVIPISRDAFTDPVVAYEELMAAGVGA